MYKLSAFADEASPIFKEQIEALKRNDIAFIEVRGINGKSVMDYELCEIKEFKKELDANGIKLSALGSPIGKAYLSDFTNHMELFKKALDICTILDTDRIRMFSFFVDDDCDDKKNEVLEKLGIMKREADKAGIKCCHENEKGIYGHDLKHCLDIHRELGIKAVFDFANFIQCGDDPLFNFEKLRPYIEYIHIKDALKSDGSVVPAGKGDGNIKKILQSFKSSDVTYLTLEPHLTVFDGLSLLQDEDVKNVYTFKSNAEAFDFAVSSLREILSKI